MYEMTKRQEDENGWLPYNIVYIQTNRQQLTPWHRCILTSRPNSRSSKCVIQAEWCLNELNELNELQSWRDLTVKTVITTNVTFNCSQASGVIVVSSVQFNNNVQVDDNLVVMLHSRGKLPHRDSLTHIPASL